jgi:hypothetical protein
MGSWRPKLVTRHIAEGCKQTWKGGKSHNAYIRIILCADVRGVAHFQYVSVVHSWHVSVASAVGTPEWGPLPGTVARTARASHRSKTCGTLENANKQGTALPHAGPMSGSTVLAQLNQEQDQHTLCYEGSPQLLASWHLLNTHKAPTQTFRLVFGKGVHHALEQDGHSNVEKAPVSAQVARWRCLSVKRIIDRTGKKVDRVHMHVLNC